MKDTIKGLLSSNTNTILYGKSGWGKSQIVEQCAQELNMKCHILSLAGVAPEDFGIPAVREGYYEYLPPKWAMECYNTQENFVLFLDEITQATVQVLHAIYPLVLNKRIGGLVLPNMRIIAASNYDHENPHLTSIMTPLLNRFDVEIRIEEDFGQSLANDFWAYIEPKYPTIKHITDKLKANQIITNPRAYEAGFKYLVQNPSANKDSMHIVLRKSFGDLCPVVTREIKQKIVSNESDVSVRLKRASFCYRNNLLAIDGVGIQSPTKEQIIYAFNLSPEEQECVFV